MPGWAATSCESRGRPKTPEALVATANDAINLLDGAGLIDLAPRDAPSGGGGAGGPVRSPGADGGDRTAHRLLDYHRRIAVYMDVSLKVVGIDESDAGLAQLRIEPQYPTYPASLVRTMELAAEKTGDGGWALRDPAAIPQALIEAMGLDEELRVRD